MITDLDVPVRLDQKNWGEDAYPGIRELGFDGTLVISLYTTPEPAPRGTFFTTIPISSKAYRKTHITQCGFSRPKATKLVVYDDWGRSHNIESTVAVIDALELDCIDNDLPHLY